MTDALTGAAGPEDLVPLTLRGPGDLVDVVPYLLGFHPRDSLVVVSLHAAGAQVGVVVRADLAELRDQPELAAHLTAQLLQAGAEEIVVVVFGELADPSAEVLLGVLPERDLVAEIAAAAAGSGVRMREALFVASGRWRSYTCADEECCPAAGRPVGGATSRLAVAAATVGLVVLPDRAALAATLDPEPEDGIGLAAAVVRAEGDLARRVTADRSVEPWRAAAAARVRRSLDKLTAAGAVSWPSHSAAAKVAVGLTDRAVRDAAWLWMERSRGLCGAVLELWRELARRVPAGYRVAPLFLTGWAAWRDGAGPLARIAVDRALELDPTYSAALLLDQTLSLGLDPRTTPLLGQVVDGARMVDEAQVAGDT
ncbi:MAG TPA: DUF4192 domain-containing protein [Mycobacteriales bacterium]|nr:DUF4192 domain-containing protein [Mycobacteriales bacterium]